MTCLHVCVGVHTHMHTHACIYIYILLIFTSICLRGAWGCRSVQNRVCRSAPWLLCQFKDLAGEWGQPLKSLIFCAEFVWETGLYAVSEHPSCTCSQILFSFITFLIFAISSFLSYRLLFCYSFFSRFLPLPLLKCFSPSLSFLPSVPPLRVSPLIPPMLASSPFSASLRFPTLALHPASFPCSPISHAFVFPSLSPSARPLSPLLSLPLPHSLLSLK